MSAEPTYLEKVESYLVDEFHHGLERIMVETLWSEVRVGAWGDDLQFFKCLNIEYEYLIANQTKPLQIAMRVQNLNFSSQATVSGVNEEFFRSQLARNRQKILLLHSLRLMIENKDQGRTDLSMLLHAIRREIHQSLRLVFFCLKGNSDSNRLQDFIDKLDQFDWLEMNHVRVFLADYLISWLERQGVERTQVDDVNKLRSFSLTLTRWFYYHPKKTSGPPVHFEYGHVFRDWQRFGFFSSLHYEIDRLTSLVYLEGLSHSQAHTLDTLTGVADRKSFEDEFGRWMTRRRAEDRPFVFAMLDVDDFKDINTEYGHPGGDFALKSIAQFLKNELDPNDFIARCGEKGDEFVILLYASLDQAKQRLGELLLRLENKNFDYEFDGQKRVMSIPVSYGLAECGILDSQEHLTHRADQEMYEEKNRRKNQASSGRTDPRANRKAAG